MGKMIKALLLFIFLANYSAIIAQQKNSFELLEVNSDKTYYNLIQYNNKLYIGTSEGAIILNATENSEQLNNSLKGYLKIENGKLIGNSTNFGHIIKDNENVFNYLLPDAYKNLISRHNRYNGKLYITNSGKLFVYKENKYTISHDSLSVRSITENYIGSYKGIFKNGLKLKFPEYTDGNIREYGNETFICYEGLYRDSSGFISVFANSKKEVVIAGKNLGAARDIQLVEDGHYVLCTTLGIYLINFSKNSILPINENKKSENNYTVFKIDQTAKNSTRIFYTVGNKLFYYVVQTKEQTLLLDSKHDKTIKQAFFPNTIDKIYVLFEDKLSLFNLEGAIYEEDVLIGNLIFCHNLILFKEKIYITTNVGLHVYDLKKNKPYLNIISNEINNRSLSLIKDTIKFGTINGIVNITDDNIESIIETAENQNYLEKDDREFGVSYITIILIALIFAILIIAIIQLRISLKKSKNALELKAIPKVDYGIANKENIIYYIQENITSVTIHSIRDHFNLTPAALYEILENDKPGEIIRNYRMELVRKYRRQQISEEEIALKTGFSVSYLKKIY